MKSTTKVLVVSAVLLTLCTAFSPMLVSGASNYYLTAYLGRTTQREYVPLVVLYDPYGDKSYQTFSKSTTISTTVSFSAGGNVEVSGEVTVAYTASVTYSSSNNENDPADIGPGKGDRIIGEVWDFTWDVYRYYGPKPQSISTQANRDSTSLIQVWYFARLVSAQKVGDFCLSRRDLAATTDTRVEDKTGQLGPVHYLQDYSAYTPIDKSIGYSWSGTMSVGFSFDVNLFGFAVKFSYSMSFTQANSFSVGLHYESTYRITFYECTQAGSGNGGGLTSVQSYVFWFSPA